ncbi:Lipopolysaccharide heptosyltransferase 1 [Pontiella desulfatans]|uniref:Lipopolysaccharide heptosyltransferase 1 n=1 Tax=Pontiella desulfatans TaxID=2750659 RepID=A0A6C2U2B6_PONDE|nr:glycosyltransferase family 9 protein [Pontiella desulfatans]VGO14132.1 Lipopolysaccharide heptosyltransferase 1 [Pontiella desulfatans]
MRILIVKTSSLGDLFHALPAVHLLKQAYGAEIDWVVNSGYAGLVDCFSDVRKVIPFPRQSLFSSFGNFRNALREETYDLVVDFQGLLKSAMVCRMAKRSKGARILGTSGQREGARFFYSTVVGKKNKNRHAVEENLDVLRFLGKPEEPLEFPIRFPVVDFPCLEKHPVVVFAPCSRHEAKNWPSERFVELGEHLDAQIVLVGSPDDTETCTRIENALPEGSATNLCGKTSLLELGGVLQRADLVVTVDSGPMHMASAAGTPCLAIFGPTDPMRVGPYGGQHRVLRNSLVKNYSKQDLESIKMVETIEVVKNAREMLNHEAMGL